MEKTKYFSFNFEKYFFQKIKLLSHQKCRKNLSFQFTITKLLRGKINVIIFCLAIFGPNFFWFMFPTSKIRQYRRFYLKFADFAILEAENRGLLAFGDLSPAQIFHRQREAQNRGFGDISPEMATLVCFENWFLHFEIFGGKHF